jgi:DNA gyrase subunit A
MVVADPEATLLTACAHGYGKRTPFGPNAAVEEDPGEEDASSSFRYRTQNRGGKGLRDIKTTDRNGSVIAVVRCDDQDELMMMTARGKIQRVKASDFNVIGRNTQGVRIITLDEGDALAAVVRVPKEDAEEDAGPSAIVDAATDRRIGQTDDDDRHDDVASEEIDRDDDQGDDALED